MATDIIKDSNYAMISHLLVLLNFFSHFLLYSHSCQWSVGTVKHVQSPSAFTASPAGSKMPVLISKNLWVLKMVRLQSIPCKHPTLTQHFLKLLQAAGTKISKHLLKKLIRSLYNKLSTFIAGLQIVTERSSNAQINGAIKGILYVHFKNSICLAKIHTGQGFDRNHWARKKIK